MSTTESKMPRLTKTWIFDAEFNDDDDFVRYLEENSVSKEPFRVNKNNQCYRCVNYTRHKCKFEIKVEGDDTKRVFHSGDHLHNDETAKPKYGVDKDRLQLLDEVG